MLLPHLSRYHVSTMASRPSHLWRLNHGRLSRLDDVMRHYQYRFSSVASPPRNNCCNTCRDAGVLMPMKGPLAVELMAQYVMSIRISKAPWGNASSYAWRLTYRGLSPLQANQKAKRTVNWLTIRSCRERQRFTTNGTRVAEDG